MTCVDATGGLEPGQDADAASQPGGIAGLRIQDRQGASGRRAALPAGSQFQRETEATSAPDQRRTAGSLVWIHASLPHPFQNNIMANNTIAKTPAGGATAPSIIERADRIIAESQLARAEVLAKRDRLRAEFEERITPRLLELADMYRSAGVEDVELCVEYPSHDFDDMRNGRVNVYYGAWWQHRIEEIDQAVVRVCFVSSENKLSWSAYLERLADNLVSARVVAAKLAGHPMAETPPLVVTVRRG